MWDPHNRGVVRTSRHKHVVDKGWLRSQGSEAGIQPSHTVHSTCQRNKGTAAHIVYKDKSKVAREGHKWSVIDRNDKRVRDELEHFDEPVCTCSVVATVPEVWSSNCVMDENKESPSTRTKIHKCLLQSGTQCAVQ